MQGIGVGQTITHYAVGNGRMYYSTPE